MTKLWTLLGAVALAGCMQTQTAPNAGVAMTGANADKLKQIGAEILFWNQAQRDTNFPHMETLFPGRAIKAGNRVRALPPGKPLDIAGADVEA